MVKSVKLYEGCYKIVFTLLAEECEVEHLKLEEELEKENKVRCNNVRLFQHVCKRHKETCNRTCKNISLMSQDKQ